MNNTVVDQRDEWTGYGMDYATSLGFFDRRYMERYRRTTRRGIDGDGNRTLVGAVSEDYAEWLQENYGLDIVINHSELEPVP
jgi:hypothetical protein